MTKEKTSDRVYGERPVHVHFCGTAGSDTVAHEWRCNSPYCPEKVALCPEHGGPEPIIQGYEARH